VGPIPGTGLWLGSRGQPQRGNFLKGHSHEARILSLAPEFVLYDQNRSPSICVV
jgi:hypothetical protein